MGGIERHKRGLKRRQLSGPFAASKSSSASSSSKSASSTLASDSVVSHPAVSTASSSVSVSVSASSSVSVSVSALSSVSVSVSVSASSSVSVSPASVSMSASVSGSTPVPSSTSCDDFRQSSVSDTDDFSSQFDDAKVIDDVNEILERNWTEIQRDQAKQELQPEDSGESSKKTFIEPEKEKRSTHHSVGCQTEKIIFPGLTKSSQPVSVGTQTERKNWRLDANHLRTEEDYKKMCGVSRSFFRQVLIILDGDITNSRSSSKEDKIMMFFMKIRHNLSYFVMSKIFLVHRTTISEIVENVLDSLYKEASIWSWWIPKGKVQATMPAVFKEHHPNTRAILDASEIKCEAPRDVRPQALCYSQYKSSCTMKYLVAIAPSGFITFISRAYGGRVTDTQITVESGFLDLLEPGDLILADKGFPKIIEKANEQGAFIVMPPFKRGERQFSELENTEGYKCSRLRIHVERAIARMKVFKVLKFLDHSLLSRVNKLLAVIVYIVNHFPPLIQEPAHSST